MTRVAGMGANIITFQHDNKLKKISDNFSNYRVEVRQTIVNLNWKIIKHNLITSNRNNFVYRTFSLLFNCLCFTFKTNKTIFMKLSVTLLHAECCRINIKQLNSRMKLA